MWVRLQQSNYMICVLDASVKDREWERMWVKGKPNGFKQLSYGNISIAEAFMWSGVVGKTWMTFSWRSSWFLDGMSNGQKVSAVSLCYWPVYELILWGWNRQYWDVIEVETRSCMFFVMETIHKRGDSGQLLSGYCGTWIKEIWSGLMLSKGRTKGKGFFLRNS